MKKVLPLIAAIVVFLAACGEKATPTMDGQMVQASAVAMAFTMQAQTQMAAPPTATQVPTQAATDTPIPVPTIIIPTLPPTLLPTLTQSASGGCQWDSGWKGPSVYLRLENDTKGSVVASLYLTPTAFNCGFVPLPSIGKGDEVALDIPQGCYYPSAYINDPKQQRAIEGPSRCIHGYDKIELHITYEGFKWIFP